MYGWSQSPKTPSLLKPSVCFSTKLKAKSLQVFLNLATLTSSLLIPKTWIALFSVGKPCVSYPGIYGVLYPFKFLYLTTVSFNILFNACPMWISPFAYGGPSCKIKYSFFSFFFSIFSYSPSLKTLSITFGSFSGKFALIGKSVFGKFNVVP